ncbi:methyltransferase [Mycobacterium shigaense]|nr:class I SAM-dependent methyltransferase [Mycobacterium shigaense]MEA1123032.1 class I SAM-dependent methyltransferase [Mycobacterium shigaense]PRI13450.1 methyltransferase [Mycobacterium shigaense]
MMFGTREPFEYYLCAACDTLQIVNILEGEELAAHYPPNYYSYNASPKVIQWLTTQKDRFELETGGRVVGTLLGALPNGIVRVVMGDIVRMLRQLELKPDARIIDVGCGGGVLLDRLAAIGFTSLSGADPFIEADGTTPHGVPLAKRYLSDVTGEFDLIMFNHSLEHMPDPVATLRAAREKLASGGRCLVRLPTTSSEVWSVYQQDWLQIDAPRHIVIPSRKGMALAAETVSLEVEQTFDDSTLFQFLGSEAYRHDIALNDPKILRFFGPTRVWRWQKRTELLNRQGRGDQTAFVLGAK